MHPISQYRGEVHASLSFDYQGVIWLKTVKVHPPSFNSRKKNTQSFVSKEKNRTILRQKGMPIDHKDLFVASVAMYNNLNVSSTNFMDASPMLVLYGKINAVLM